MLENIKLDIIYYGTTKDFEMEFNLCGCCRMRLLTAVADDLKSFVNCIKVAVARSRVVLLCGKLDGDDGILNIISKAVGRDFEEVDNSLYAIAGEGKTKILKQSIPLVSNDGTFLGCVIEQGPQAIIMLSDNKTGRKEIMQNLIHPYVKELSKSETVSSEETAVAEEVITPPVADLPTEEVCETPVENETVSTEELTESDLSEPLNTEEQQEEALGEGNEEQAEVPEEDDGEVETVSLEDFATVSEEVSAPNTETDENDFDDDVSVDAENVSEDVKPQPSGLIFAFPDDEFDESDQKLYSPEAMEEYSNSFSLVAHNNGKNKGYKHSRRNGSPTILILICVVLCLLGILAYYLLVKPTQAGITISENFNNLFSFALRGVFKPW